MRGGVAIVRHSMTMESVWDYPRPPRLESVTKRLQVTLGGTVIADTRPRPPRARDEPSTRLLLPARGHHARSARAVRETGVDVRVEGCCVVLRRRRRSRPPCRGRCLDLSVANAGVRRHPGRRRLLPRPMDRCVVAGEVVTPQPGGFYGGWITSDLVGTVQGRARNDGLVAPVARSTASVGSRSMARIYLSPPHLDRPRARVRQRRDRVQLGGAARPPRRRFERELCASSSACRTRSRSRAAPPRSTSRSSSLGIGAGDEVALLVAHVRRERERHRVRRVRRRSSSTATPRPGRWIRRSSTRCSPTGAAGSRSEAVIAVDLYGQCCDYDAIRAALRRATACRSSRTPPRRSARPTVATPSGGQGDARRLLVQRQQDHHDERRRHARLGAPRTGSSTRASSRTQARDPAPHYEHTEIGFNYRLSNLLAAVGRGQLEVLPDRVARAARGSTRATASCSRDVARDRVHARGRVRRRATAGSPASSSTRTRSGATARRSGSRSRREDIEARPALEADAPAARLRGTHPISAATCRPACSSSGLCLPSGSALTRRRPGSRRRDLLRATAASTQAWTAAVDVVEPVGPALAAAVDRVEVRLLDLQRDRARRRSRGRRPRAPASPRRPCRS